MEQRRKDDIFGFDEGKAEHEAEKNYWKEGAAGHIADEAAVEDPSGEVDHKEHQAVEKEGLPHFILFVYWVQQPATEHDLLIKAHEQVHRHQQRSKVLRKCDLSALAILDHENIDCESGKNG